MVRCFPIAKTGAEIWSDDELGRWRLAHTPRGVERWPALRSPRPAAPIRRHRPAL